MIPQFKKLSTSGPKFTEDVKRGFALETYKEMVEILSENIFSAVSNVTDPNLTWLGIEELNPFQEYQSDLLTLDGAPKSDKTELDISRSDVRKYICKFDYDGVPINKPLYLPVINHDGTMRISGTKLWFMPVMTDPIVAGMPDHVFTKFYMAKLRAVDMEIVIMVNGDLVRKNLIYIKDIYKLRVFTNKDLKKLITPLGIYPMARLGMKGAMRNGDTLDIIHMDDTKDIDTEKYDIYHSTMRQPNVRKIIADKNHYAVIINKDASEYTKNIAIAIIYSFDVYPLIGADIVKNKNTDKEITYWKILVGTIYSKEQLSSDGMLSSVDEHFTVLENYVDAVVTKMFKLMGLEVNNIDDYFYDQLDRYSKYREDSLQNKITVMDKHLEVVYYLIYAIIEGFNRIFRDLDRQYKSVANVGDGKIAEAAIKKGINNKHIRPRQIFKINTAATRILPLSPYATVNDNRLYNITSQQELQARGVGVNQPHRQKGSKFPKQVRVLRGYDLIAGNIGKLKKASPWPGFSRNPFTHLDDRHHFIIPDDLLSAVEHTDQILQKELIIEDDLDDRLLNILSNNDVVDDIG